MGDARLFFENSTVCLVVDAKMVHRSGWSPRSGWLVRVVGLGFTGEPCPTPSERFPVSRIDRSSLASGWGSFRVSVDCCFRVVVANETFTESLILAQDERWRRA